jgi:hypothetical protein
MVDASGSDDGELFFGFVGPRLGIVYFGLFLVWQVPVKPVFEREYFEMEFFMLRDP